MATNPLPYNRFLGNPPTGLTPEQAFEDEMGYPYPLGTKQEPKIPQVEVAKPKIPSQGVKHG